MTGNIKHMLGGYFRQNILLYLIVFIFFVLGTTSGAFLVKPLVLGQQVELLAYLDNFINSLLNMEISTIGILKQALISNFKIVFAIWFLGLTVIGVPIIIVLIFARGFVLGFTVGFLVQEKGVQGIFIALLSILPSNLMLLPAIIVGAVSAISFSLLLIRGNIRSSLMKLLQQFISYTLLMTVIVILAGVAALIEAYLAPAMMKLIAVYI